jgi:hypothetical protein
MCLNHADWSRHANKNPKPNPQMFTGPICLEASMDQKTVHPHRMSCAYSSGSQNEENRKCIKLWEEKNAEKTQKTVN